MSHVCVCVCTYKRPQSLRRLLAALSAQETDGRFTYSVVVADNDHLESARATVADFAAAAPFPVHYCVEPRQNIALARNRSIENASGDFVAITDDDQEPLPDWLLRLVETIESYAADAVFGPGVARFATPPPDWIVRGGFFDRPSPPTGTPLRWNQARTANVLLRRRGFDMAGIRFRPEYGGGGEDVDFFRRALANGLRLVSCADARVYSHVPAERCRRSYLLWRALRRGGAPYNQKAWPVAVSLVAIPLYAFALPVLPLLGQHVFMRYLIKECDHLGRILAILTGKKGTDAVSHANDGFPTRRGSNPST